ncbi:MAG: AraC family transcriptional regulator [Sphaerochaetaceae bacterium]|jgi:AraC-like DNA-binding protein
MDYPKFIAQFSVLTEEEKTYKALWKAGTLPAFPAFLSTRGAGLTDITLGDDLFFSHAGGGDCHVERHTRFLPSYIHDHQFLEMEFVMEGSCVQEVYGRKFSLEKGDGIIISPRNYHAISVYDDKSVVMNILVKSTTLENLLPPFSEGASPLCAYFASVLARKPICPSAVVHHAVETFPVIASLYTEGARSNLLALSLLAQIFALLVLLPKREITFIDPGDRKDARTTAILHYIRENPAEVTLTTLADAFGLTPAYLSALIHESTGSRFSDLLLRRKMDIALSCLSSEVPMSCTEIARKIGYGSPQHFCRTFRRCYGMTPMEYRRHQGR